MHVCTKYFPGICCNLVTDNHRDHYIPCTHGYTIMLLYYDTNNVHGNRYVLQKCSCVTVIHVNNTFSIVHIPVCYYVVHTHYYRRKGTYANVLTLTCSN